MLSLLTATITIQPRDVAVCTGGVAVFTCVVDRNGTSTTGDDVKWKQIRMSNRTSILGVSFNITTTISGDIITSTLTITGATDSNTLGTSLYHCVVSDMITGNVAIHVLTGKNS